MKRFNLTGNILDLQGDTIPAVDGKPEPLTYQVALVRAAQHFDLTASGEEKYAIYKLGQALGATKDGIVALTDDQVERLKKVIGAHYHPVVVGRIWDFLEQPIVAGTRRPKLSAVQP